MKLETIAVHGGYSPDPTNRIAMTAEKLGERMHDNVGAVIDRLAQIGRRQRVIDDQRNAGVMSDGGDGFDIDDDATGIGEVLDEDRLALGCQRAAEILRLRGIDEAHSPP